MKNIRRVRKFKCIEVIEIIDIDTGEIVDEQVVRTVKPKILISKKKYEGKSFDENVKKNIPITSSGITSKPTILPTKTSEIKIFHKKNPKHLSNGYLMRRNFTQLDKGIEKKYFPGKNINYNNNDIKNGMINYTNNDYGRVKYFVNEKVNDKWMIKSIHVPNIINDERKKVHNTSEKIIPINGFDKTESGVETLKNVTKLNVTSINIENSKDKIFNLPEPPPYIPHRPENHNYPSGNNFKTRVYPKSDYTKVNSENDSIDKNILFTTPKPLITPSYTFMNQAPLVEPNLYTTNVSKQKNLKKGDSSRDNLTMTKENCSKMSYFAKTFGINDVQKWIRDNCIFARFYLPQATCQDIYTFVDSCYKKFYL